MTKGVVCCRGSFALTAFSSSLTICKVQSTTSHNLLIHDPNVLKVVFNYFKDAEVVLIKKPAPFGL